MKRIAAFAAGLVLASSCWAQCQPIGWVLVSQKAISATERYCEYEKSGVKTAIIVSGFCPMSPC